METDLTVMDYPALSQKRLVINAALTGMVPRKADNPNLPITPHEIIKDALIAADLGASIIHIHARGENEEPVWEREVYKKIIEGIRDKRPDLILCVTTSGRNYSEFQKRAAVLDLDGDFKPDMASLTMGSMNFATQASVNPPEVIQGLARQMLDRGIKPELEVFEPGMIDYAKYLYKKGFLQPPFYFNLLLGSLGTINATPKNLQFMVNNLPLESIWAATGIGASQAKMELEAIKQNGGVRVGLEDYLFLDENKKQIASNEALIRRVLGWAKEHGQICGYGY